MSLPASSENKFDQYLLQQIKENEQKARRQRILTIAALVVMLAGGFLLVQQFVLPDEEPQRRMFQHDQLTTEMVAQLFREDTLGILIDHPILGEDTITSPADYQRFRELVELLKNTDLSTNGDSVANFVTDKRLSSANLIQSTPNAELQPFRVDIRGSQQAGKKMSFAIENFDPNVRYTLDFGNGVRRGIRQRTQYAYPLHGSYTIRLIATSQDRGSSISVQTIYIQPKSTEPLAIAAQNRRQETTESSPIDIPQMNRATQFTVPRSSQDPNSQSSTVRTPSNLGIVDLGALEQKKEASQQEIIPASQVNLPASTNLKPLVVAERMPAFPGGRTNMRKYIGSSINYPAEAMNAQVQGQVVIQFVVKADGSITQAKVLRGIGSGCDQEALRLVRNMPKWIPGESKGKRVPVYQTVPVTFQISQ